MENMDLTQKQLESLSPQELCSAYRKQLNRLYGTDRATNSRVDHDNGWYYILVATKYADGSCGAGGRLPDCHRKKAVIEMILELQKRHDTANEDISSPVFLGMKMGQK